MKFLVSSPPPLLLSPPHLQVLATTLSLSAAQYGLVGHPNGAVVPVDEPAVQAARADHFAAGGGHGGYAGVGYAAAPVAVAAAPVYASASPVYAAGYGYAGPLNLNTHLVGHPNGAVVPVDEPAVAAARADHFAAGGGRVAPVIAAPAIAAPAIAAPAIAAPAIAAPAIAAPAVVSGYSSIAAPGLIGGYSGLASGIWKREADAEPQYFGAGYGHAGLGYAGVYGYGKSAPCVNAFNLPVPCRGFY